MANQQTDVVVALREMIYNGVFAPEERIAEIPVAQRLGVSRTPVRFALGILEQEGLLERADTRGYVVRRFRVPEIADAIDVRAVLEGLAARLVAEHGVPRALSKELRDCLNDGDAIFAKGHLDEGDQARYCDMNDRFHSAINLAAGNEALIRALTLNNKVPFSAATVVFDRDAMEDEYRKLNFDHMTHHLIVAALEAGEGARAEALMREHANSAKLSLNIFKRKDLDAANFAAPGLRLVAE